MAGIESMLSEADLKALRDVYNTMNGRVTLEQRMQKTLPQLYSRATGYVGAIMEALYGELPPDDAPTPRECLSRRDRERCLIALLASRGEDMTLAIHIYFGLMENIAPSEVAHILLLAGIYSGVDNFTKGLLTTRKLLTALGQWAAESKKSGNWDLLRADQILDGIRALFEPVAAVAVAAAPASGRSGSSRNG